MEIIAHRGFWTHGTGFAKNSKEALLEALEYGFGFETDIRDAQGTLVVSHDMPNSPFLLLEDILKVLAKKQGDFCFAMNIKSDGLTGLLKKNLAIPFTQVQK